MKCPICGNENTAVKDSRASNDGISVRRIRVCLNDDGTVRHTFTTYELPSKTDQKRAYGYVLGGIGAAVYSRQDIWSRILASCLPAGCTFTQAQKILFEAEKSVFGVSAAFTIAQSDLVILRTMLKLSYFSCFTAYASSRFELLKPDDLKRIEELTNLSNEEIQKLRDYDFPTPRVDIIEEPNEFRKTGKGREEAEELQDVLLGKETSQNANVKA